MFDSKDENSNAVVMLLSLYVNEFVEIEISEIDWMIILGIDLNAGIRLAGIAFARLVGRAIKFVTRFDLVIDLPFILFVSNLYFHFSNLCYLV